MSSSARNGMAGSDANFSSRGLSDGAIAAISVIVSVGTVVVMLTLYLWLYHRKRTRRASLEAIGGGNLYKNPPSARDSEIMVTREVYCGRSPLPTESVRGSYSSTQPILRGSYQSTSSKAQAQAPPPRPSRPSWPSSVLEANSAVDIEGLTPTCAPLTKPIPVHNSLSPCQTPRSPSSRFLKDEDVMLGGGGQVVTTYRHPTPILKEDGDFMSSRQRAQVERTLGANPGMSEVGFRREYYTMYAQGEDLKRESWRGIGKGVVLNGEAREIREWTRKCGARGEIGLAR